MQTCEFSPPRVTAVTLPVCKVEEGLLASAHADAHATGNRR